jgi:hypothetical protein
LTPQEMKGREREEWRKEEGKILRQIGKVIKI